MLEMLFAFLCFLPPLAHPFLLPSFVRSLSCYVLPVFFYIRSPLSQDDQEEELLHSATGHKRPSRVDRKVFQVLRAVVSLLVQLPCLSAPSV